MYWSVDRQNGVQGLVRIVPYGSRESGVGRGAGRWTEGCGSSVPKFSAVVDENRVGPRFSQDPDDDSGSLVDSVSGRGPNRGAVSKSKVSEKCVEGLGLR